MKDMTIIDKKRIVNKDTNEVRLVVEIDEENRKIYSVPADQPDTEPTEMAAATYDRRWDLYHEPEAPAPNLTVNGVYHADEPESGESAVPEQDDESQASAHTEGTADDEAMKMSETVKGLEQLFDTLNGLYFEGKLPKPVITVQTTPRAYGHCTTKKIWKSETEAQYEINLGAEFINRPKAQTCATLLHEMVHLFCTENEIADTCQHGRYHNKAFKVECEQRNLAVEYDRANGYAHTAPTDAFKEQLTEIGVDLETPFAKLARTLPRGKAKAEREKAHKYVCPVCGQEVRTTAELSLICGVCEVPMDRIN